MSSPIAMALLDNKMPINEKLHLILEELEKDKLLVETKYETRSDLGAPKEQRQLRA